MWPGGRAVRQQNGQVQTIETLVRHLLPEDKQCKGIREQNRGEAHEVFDVSRLEVLEAIVAIETFL